ncbi:hypothetical protein AGMMS49545_13070 [Betaproteobacteria bacterium]|nr:hypothetical protein AGMMS49545_13070 [Betaproteobacteria bacterium]GHU44700.1 hypothetical protein AGMMS50289_13620 [Betaproteobacteria bacterium]
MKGKKGEILHDRESEGRKQVRARVDERSVIPIRMRSETRRLPEDSAIARRGEVDKGSLLMRIGIRFEPT